MNWDVIKEKLTMSTKVFSNPKEIFQHVKDTTEFDWLQAGIIAVLVGIASAITKLSIGSFFSGGIGTFVGFLLGMVISALFVSLAGGIVSYPKIFNLIAFMGLLEVITTIVARVPVLGGLVSFGVGIYTIYLMVTGLSEITGAKKSTLIICYIVVFVILLVIVFIIGVIMAAALSQFYLW